MKPRLLLLLLCLASAVHAQDRALPGTLVRISPDLQAGESALWIPVSPATLDFEIGDSGKFIAAAPCDGTKQLIIWLLAQQIKDGVIQTRQKQIRIEIGSGVIQPPDEPQPPPPPTSGLTPDQISDITGTTTMRAAAIADPATATALGVAYSKAVAGLGAVRTVAQAESIVEKHRGDAMSTRPFPRTDWTQFLVGMSQKRATFPSTLTDLNDYKLFLDAMIKGLASAGGQRVQEMECVDGICYPKGT